jgi:hypothetical protein
MRREIAVVMGIITSKTAMPARQAAPTSPQRKYRHQPIW